MRQAILIFAEGSLQSDVTVGRPPRRRRAGDLDVSHRYTGVEAAMIKLLQVAATPRPPFTAGRRSPLDITSRQHRAPSATRRPQPRAAPLAQIA